MNWQRPMARLLGAVTLLCLIGATPIDTRTLSAGSSTLRDESREAYSLPSPAMQDEHEDMFRRGRSLFRQSWVIAPANDREVLLRYLESI